MALDAHNRGDRAAAFDLPCLYGVMNLYIARLSALPIGAICARSDRLIRAMSALSTLISHCARFDFMVRMKSRLQEDARFRARVFADLGGERAAKAWETRFARAARGEYNGGGAAAFDASPPHRPRADRLAPEAAFFKWKTIDYGRRGTHSGYFEGYAARFEAPMAMKPIELCPHDLRPDKITPKASEPAPKPRAYQEACAYDDSGPPVLTPASQSGGGASAAIARASDPPSDYA